LPPNLNRINAVSRASILAHKRLSATIGSTCNAYSSSSRLVRASLQPAHDDTFPLSPSEIPAPFQRDLPDMARRRTSSNETVRVLLKVVITPQQLSSQTIGRRNHHRRRFGSDKAVTSTSSGLVHSWVCASSRPREAG
jgi:hypothetical protein